MPKKIGFSRYEENFPGSDVTTEEWDFLHAVESYKQKHHRRFPSLREILGVLKTLGYRKVPAEVTPPPAPSSPKVPKAR